MTGTAIILGLAYESSLTRFTVRTGPGTTFDTADFMGQKDTRNLKVLDIQPDDQETKSDFGRVYQWFHLEFPDSRRGWMRDHVIGVIGDFEDWGYGTIYEEKHAYLLIRDMSKIAAREETANQPPAEPIDAPTMTKEAGQTQTVPAIPPEPEEITPVKRDPVVKPIGPEDPVKQEQPTAEEATTTEDETEPTATQTMQKQRGFIKPVGPPTATVKTIGEAYVRQGPSTVGYSRIFSIPRDQSARILDVVREGRAQNLRWYQIDYNGRQGWIREDLVNYGGDTEAVGLPWDVYPAPMFDARWWVRDYNFTPNFDASTWEHKGWDFGAKLGEPIYCGPLGGEVVSSVECTRCTPSQPSTISQGLGLGNQNVFNDPAWGYGYGNYVIVKYSNDILPDSTRDKMTSLGYGGGSVFVLYGHLHERKADVGDTFTDAQVIGTCGNTGNSQAEHLHLEVRLSKLDQFTGWYNIMDGLISPIILFNR